MKGKLGNVEKSKSLKIASDGMIESLLTSDDLESVKLAVEVLEAREFERKVDAKYQADKYMENQRQAEYYEAGYGHILSNKWEMPVTTRDNMNKFLNEPTWAERMSAIQAKNIDSLRMLLTQSISFVLIIGALIIFT
jgi:hypothetical protein